MSSVLLIQNTRTEGSGYLGELLKNDGFDITNINAKYDSLPKNDFSLVVILGAPESVNDNLNYLREEQKLIQNTVEKKIPVLGICLGSQLIAKTFGASVYRGLETEIGFYDDLKISNNSKLFLGMNKPFTVFHWHGDTFD
ncbi:MAG TPA: type 1 glutamine amidotransferase, partial [Nitrosopumilus sp.]|nr:type 1 glutamine amidotransferase [Nitrosopumilus sp.]